MSVASEWSRFLKAWALPPELLAAAPASPYEWPVEMFKRRAGTEKERGARNPTHEVIADLIRPGDTLLDVGAGTGRVSLPFARSGHRVVAVEQNQGMAAGLRAAADAAGVGVEVIEQGWPAAAVEVGEVDVAVSANVVYDVADIGPFVSSVNDAAPHVVIELTDHHPWADLSPYYQALHEIDRPDGPTADLFLEVVAEVTGRDADWQRWTRPPSLFFESWDEILVYYGRRLLVGPDRHEELRALLEPEVQWDGSRASMGGDRSLMTVWW